MVARASVVPGDGGAVVASDTGTRTGDHPHHERDRQRPAGDTVDDDVMVADAVVVEQQVVIEHEDTQPRVLVARGVEHATLARRPVHGGQDVPAPTRGSGCDLGG